MTKAILISIILTSLVALRASAQGDVYDRDFSIGAGGAGGCSLCAPQGGNSAACRPIRNDPACWEGLLCTQYEGYASCTAHNAQFGPPYCEVSGECSVMSPVAHKLPVVPVAVGAYIENQISGIEVFLRRSGVIDDAAMDDFVAATDFSVRGLPYKIAAQKRLIAYRAEFNKLVSHGDRSRELRLGAIPIMPYSRPVEIMPIKSRGSVAK